jgi:hypothetical protein
MAPKKAKEAYSMRSLVAPVFLVLALLSLSCSSKGESSEKGMLPTEESDAYGSFTVDDCPAVCSFVPGQGECVGEISVTCVEGVPQCEDCALAAGIQTQCVFDSQVGTTACRPLDFIGPTCIPDCTDVECGDDGCGGSCGFCPEGSVCDGEVCRLFGASCGTVDVMGKCIDDVLTACVNGGLAYLDCEEIGRVCELNISTGMYDCLLP